MSIPTNRFVAMSEEDLFPGFALETQEEAEKTAMANAKSYSIVYVVLEVHSIAVPKVEVDAAFEDSAQL